MFLPVELWNCIFFFLNGNDLLSIVQVKYFNNIAVYNIKKFKQKKILLLVNNGYSYIEKIYINEGYAYNNIKISLKKIITILLEYTWFSKINIKLLVFLLMEWIYLEKDNNYKYLIASHRGTNDYTKLYETGCLDMYCDKIREVIDTDTLRFFS